VPQSSWILPCPQILSCMDSVDVSLQTVVSETVGLSLNLSLPESSPPVMDDLYVLPRYHESKGEETTLSDVLDSYLPFIQDKDSSINLSIYLGNSSVTLP
jgi:hypothetical protein